MGVSVSYHGHCHGHCQFIWIARKASWTTETILSTHNYGWGCHECSLWQRMTQIWDTCVGKKSSVDAGRNFLKEWGGRECSLKEQNDWDLGHAEFFWSLVRIIVKPNHYFTTSHVWRQYTTRTEGVSVRFGATNESFLRLTGAVKQNHYFTTSHVWRF
jgi:hypothetical protein